MFLTSRVSSVVEHGEGLARDLAVVLVLGWRRRRGARPYDPAWRACSSNGRVRFAAILAGRGAASSPEAGSRTCSFRGSAHPSSEARGTFAGIVEGLAHAPSLPCARHRIARLTHERAGVT